MRLMKLPARKRCGARYAKYDLLIGATERAPKPTGGRVGSDAVSDRTELLAQILTKAVLHGAVTLSSGQQADWYIDLRRITLHGEAARLTGRVMLDLTSGLQFDAVGGLTLGADPVAAAMMHTATEQGRPMDSFVVRKEGKAPGLRRRIEGPDVAGRRVLAVEDTSTTGKSVLEAVDALTEAGAQVAGVERHVGGVGFEHVIEAGDRARGPARDGVGISRAL